MPQLLLVQERRRHASKSMPRHDIARITQGSQRFVERVLAHHAFLATEHRKHKPRALGRDFFKVVENYQSLLTQGYDVWRIHLHPHGGYPPLGLLEIDL